MDLLKIIFIFLLFIALPLGEISRISFMNGIAFTFLDAGVFLLFFVWLVRFTLKRRKFNFKYTTPILLFIFTQIISLFVNFNNLNYSEFLVSFLYLIRWILYAAVFLVVLDFDIKFKRKIPYFMLVSGLFIIAGGFIQYFFYPNLRNLYYAGWDEHLYRLFSSFLDPNFAGAFLTLYLLFVLNLYFQNKEKNHKYKLVFVVLLSFFAIFLTFSRSAFIMLFVGLFIFFAQKNKIKFFLGFLAGSIIVFLLLFKFTLQSEGTNLFRTASLFARLDSSKNAVTIFKDHPIFGVGFNSYRFAQKRYGFIDKNWQFVHSGAGTDNSFLFVLATTGIIGLVAFLYMWIKLVKFAKSDVFTSSLIALFVNSLFVNSLFYTCIIFWIWVLLALKKNT